MGKREEQRSNMGTGIPAYQLSLGPATSLPLGWKEVVTVSMLSQHHSGPSSPSLAFRGLDKLCGHFRSLPGSQGWSCDPIWPIGWKQRFSRQLVGNFCSPDLKKEKKRRHTGESSFPPFLGHWCVGTCAAAAAIF